MSSSKDLHHHRRNYERHELTEDRISPNPFEQFGWWFEDASQGEIVEPNAMVLSTVSADGNPSSRVVLLKAFDENGFVFYTNYKSKKGQNINENPHACLLFFGINLNAKCALKAQ